MRPAHSGFRCMKMGLVRLLQDHCRIIGAGEKYAGVIDAVIDFTKRIVVLYCFNMSGTTGRCMYADQDSE